MVTGYERCAARSKGCGTSDGWSAGGRCGRCRRARVREEIRSRGRSARERDAVVDRLGNGSTPGEAARAVGRTERYLVGESVHDLELRAALDGQPAAVRAAARKAGYLAALLACGGAKVRAQREVPGRPLEQPILAEWRCDPAFLAAENAIVAWVSSAAQSPRARISAAELECAADVIEAGGSLNAASKRIGVSFSSLAAAAHRSSRLRAAMEAAGPLRRGVTSKLTPSAADRLRELWPTPRRVHDIGAELGVSHYTVYKWARQIGLRTPRPRS